MKSARFVFAGSQKPLSRLVLREFVRQCDEVVCLPHHPQSPAVVPRGPDDEGLMGAPLIALITWADLLEEMPGSVASRMTDCIDSFKRSTHNTGRITVCVVPYGAFADSDRRTHNFLCCGASESAGANGTDDMFSELINPLAAMDYDYQLVTSPMLISKDNDEACGYPSVLHKAMRIARCLSCEVTSKVPDYFSRFSLQLDPAASPEINVATTEHLVSWLLDNCNRPNANGPTPPVLHLENVLRWSTVAEPLKDSLGVVLRRGEDKRDLNTLDRLFNELVSSDQALYPYTVVYVAQAEAVRALSCDGIPDTLSHLASQPCEPWESSYAPDRSRDLDAIAGMRLKRLDDERIDKDESPAGAAHRQLAYYEGGAGETILLIPPMGIDPGYYAAVVDDLIDDHRVLVWQTRRNDVAHRGTSRRQDIARHSASIRDVLRREGVADCHLVAWCDGVRVAAKLVDDCGPMLRTISLIAPEICGDGQSVGHEGLSLFFTQLNEHPEQAECLIAQASKSFREKPWVDLEQYSPRARFRRSPLQYHSREYWSGVAEDAFTENILMWAQQSPESIGDVDAVRERLAEFRGPVLVIVGTHDSLIQYAGVREKCRGRTRWTLATFLGGNHYLLTEHGPTAAKLLRQFIRDGAIASEMPEMMHGGRVRIEGGTAGSPDAGRDMHQSGAVSQGWSSTG